MKIKIAANGKASGLENGKLTKIDFQALPRWIESSENIELEIELPNFHCNVGGVDPSQGQRACLVCPRDLPGFHPETDRLDQVCDSIRPFIQNVSVVRFAGLAEPFWKSRIFELLDHLEIQKNAQVKIIAVTNGTLVEPDVCQRWLETVPSSQLSFSLDATTEETYVKLRRIAEFEKVVENMDHYCRTRNPDHHVAVLSNNINTINAPEIQHMVEMTKTHFLHYAHLTLTEPVGRRLKGICINSVNAPIFSEARALASATAAELGVNVVFGGQWPSEK
ncbi:MAG: radical SAM protein [Planctomycetota bacterium]|nr:radical SAM protein [Planctomycetota bacterium]